MDISQNPHCKIQLIDGLAPPMLRGSLFWSFGKNRLLTPTEMLLAQGIVPHGSAMALGIPPSFPVAVDNIFRHMSLAQTTKVAGNGMHTAVAGYMCLFVLGTAIERAEVWVPDFRRDLVQGDDTAGRSDRREGDDDDLPSECTVCQQD